jgi:hypothetical protein
MDASELYGLPLDRFVPERDALARALRADGRREQAAEVARLRKPSLAAWAVNQLMRTQARAVRDLLEAGDALQRAQAELLAGSGDAQALREAGERERAAVDELTSVARGLLTSEGHELTQTTLDRVAATLHAAAFDEQARAQVQDGCLERELRHVGLGGAGARVTGGPSSKVAESRRVEAEARHRAEQAAEELRAARARRDRCAEALREAEGALAEAGRRAEEAQRAHRDAIRALERLRPIE